MRYVVCMALCLLPRVGTAGGGGARARRRVDAASSRSLAHRLFASLYAENRADTERYILMLRVTSGLKGEVKVGTARGLPR